jgi:hypothetical protein
MFKFIIEYSLQDAVIPTQAESSLKLLLSVEATTSTHHFSCAPRYTDDMHQNVFPQNSRDVFEMAKIPKSDQSQNTSRKYKSEK